MHSQTENFKQLKSMALVPTSKIFTENELNGRKWRKKILLRKQKEKIRLLKEKQSKKGKLTGKGKNPC